MFAQLEGDLHPIVGRVSNEGGKGRVPVDDRSAARRQIRDDGIFLRCREGHRLCRQIAGRIGSGQGQRMGTGTQGRGIKGVWQRDRFPIQHCRYRHFAADRILRRSADRFVSDHRAVREVRLDLRCRIVDGHLYAGSTAGDRMGTIAQRRRIQQIALSVEGCFRYGKGHIQDLDLRRAIAHADLILCAIGTQCLRILRVPVVCCVFDRTDTVDPGIALRAQRRAVRQQQTDVLQDKVIVVLDVMFQSVGLVSGMEGDRDLFAVRIEVSGIDIVGIGRPGIVGSLVEDTERLITDRDRIFEEDIGLGSVKRDLCAVLDRRVRLDRLTVDLQVRTGTDDLVDTAEQCALRNVEAVAHRDRLFVIDRADIAPYPLVAVTDLKVVSVSRLAEQIYRRQRIAEHIPVVSQQVVDHIVL